MLKKLGEKKQRMQKVSVLLMWKPRGVLTQRAHEGGQLLLYQEGPHATAFFSVILEKSPRTGGRGGRRSTEATISRDHKAHNQYLNLLEEVKGNNHLHSASWPPTPEWK